MTPDISIIICTYNPDQRILERCLRAVAALDRTGLEAECFLVDNNSPSPIGEQDYVKNFLSDCNWATLLVEKNQGLTHARLCGFRQTKAPLIVFFDDDNEPDSKYLQGIKDFAERRPYVGAFGPSIIDVDLLDPSDPWIDQRREYFQKTATHEEDYGLTTVGYQPFYPYGTGLVLKREVLEKYAAMVDGGKLSATDRKGKSLSSGGDIQLVWTCVKMGLAAGRTPLLKIMHMIQGSKANMNYLHRWSYGCGVSYIVNRLEMFPEERPATESKMMSPLKANILCLKILAFNFYKKDVGIKLGAQIGSIHGYCQAFNKKTPVVTNWMKRWFKL